MVIEVDCRDSISVPRTSETAQVDGLAVFPEQGVQRLEIGKPNGVKGGAYAGSASRVARIVDGVSVAVRVVGIRGEFVDICIAPNHGLELEFLRTGGRACRVRRAVLCHPGHFTWAVDLVGLAVVASQRRKGRHDAVLPHECKTGSAGRSQAQRREAAKILAARVRTVGLGFTHGLPIRVHAVRLAVLSFESGLTKIHLPALIPKPGMNDVSDLRRADDPAVVADGERLPVRAHHAEIDDVIKVGGWARATAAIRCLPTMVFQSVCLSLMYCSFIRR